MKSKINIVTFLILFLSLTSFDNLKKVKLNNRKVIQTQVNCRSIARDTYTDCINHGFDVFESINISYNAYNSCMMITQ